MSTFKKSLAILTCLVGLGRSAMESDKYAESTCAPGITPASNLKSAWITKIAAWYVPLGSAHVYHTWVEKFTNKSSTAAQIPQLCLKLLFLAAKTPNQPYMIVAGGLNKAVGYKCTAKAPHTQTCDGVPGSPQFAAGTEFEETAIQTDNLHYVLMVQCIRQKLKSWYVITPHTVDLSAAVKQEVLIAVTKLGFDKKYANSITYDKCPKAKA